MNILFVGDVFGSAGRHIVREHLPHVLETNAVDLLVINGENAAGGFGITPSIAEELFDLGAHGAEQPEQEGEQGRLDKDGSPLRTILRR